MQNGLFTTILYTQILHRAGYKVIAIDGLSVTRGAGTRVLGRFERDGQPINSVLVDYRKARTHRDSDTIIIEGQAHGVTVHEDGTFDLLVAHSDTPR